MVRRTPNLESLAARLSFLRVTPTQKKRRKISRKADFAPSPRLATSAKDAKSQREEQVKDAELASQRRVGGALHSALLAPAGVDARDRCSHRTRIDATPRAQASVNPL